MMQYPSLPNHRSESGNGSRIDSSQEDHPQVFDDLQGWTAIGSLILVTVICIAVGAGKVLNILFPAWSLVVGIILYFRHPILYNGFVWWMWFMVAFVRRLADFRSGYTEPSPILLAPYLVSFVSAITLFKRLGKAQEDRSLPFILPLYAALYGLIIGLLLRPSFLAFRGFLDWSSPLFMAFHLFVNWRLYPQYRRNTQKVFLWGVLIMSIYAVQQFLNLPEWDLLWLKESGMESASGSAEDGGVRVWGTMQSVEPFTAVLSGGLLILLSCMGGLGLPASIIGSLVLLICRVRAAWIGWIFGLLSFIGALKTKNQLQLMAIAVILIACLVPLVALPEFSDAISSRFDTFNDVSNDRSASVRQDTFNMLIGPALASFIGEGLGPGSMDNAILSMLFYIGWVGTVPYVAGLIIALVKMFQTPTNSKDLFATVARGVVMSTIVRVPFNGSHLGPSGALMWCFMALALAAERYRIYEENTKAIQELEYLRQLEADSDHHESFSSPHWSN
jgi:hypothetical protein